MKLKYLLIGLLISLGACDNSEEEVQPEAKYLIKEVIRNGVTISSYSYDDEYDLIERIYHTYKGEFYSKHEVFYENDTVVIKVTRSNPIYSRIEKYYKVDENVSRQDYFDVDGEPRGYHLYHFDNNPCGFIAFETYDNDGKLHYKFINEYIDNNCNYEERVYRYEELIRMSFITQDGNMGYRNSGLPLDFFRIKNLPNILEQTSISAQGDTIKPLSYTVEYEYNIADYPIKSTRTYKSGEIETYVYEYEVVD